MESSDQPTENAAAAVVIDTPPLDASPIDQEHQPPAQAISTIVTSLAEPETVEEQPAESTGAPAGSSAAMKHGGGGGSAVRDSTWLELEVCREFLRGDCSRSAEDCRFAHPTGSVIVKEGKVTCCFDFLKDRCTRDTCKYLHPSNTVKERLIMAGKQYGQAMSVTSKSNVPPPLSPTPQAVPIGVPYSFFIESSSSTPRQVQYMDYPTIFTFPSQQMMTSSRIPVCETFDSNITCPHGANCFFAHPEPYVRRDNNNTVSVCWNFLKGFCRHAQCWFYHPPPQIMYSILNGGLMSPQQIYVDPLMMPPYTTTEKSPYSSPTSSLGHYSYPILPVMSHYSPTATTTTPLQPVPGISTLQQTIVQ